MIKAIYPDEAGNLTVHIESQGRTRPADCSIATLTTAAQTAFATGLAWLTAQIDSDETYSKTVIEPAAQVIFGDPPQSRPVWEFFASVAGPRGARCLQINTEAMPSELRDAVLTAIAELPAG